MKIHDILFEAKIFSRGTYSYGHKVKLAKSANGQKLTHEVMKQIPDFNRDEELTWVETAPANSTKIRVGRENQEIHLERPNGSIFTLVGSIKVIESGLNHAGKHSKFTRGDIAEGILGAAITAKLIKRGTDKIGNISIDDLKSILAKSVKDSDTELSLTVQDKNSNIADNISFRLQLSGPNLEVISDPSKWDNFPELFSSAVHYANSSDAERYSNYFYQNGKVDEVQVLSDGLSNQKSKKTDISVIATDPVTGKKRTLKNVDISLKADSARFGQVGAGGKTGGSPKWLSSAKAVFEPFGITIDVPYNTSDIVQFYKQVYAQAGLKLKEKLKGDSLQGETKFVNKVADVIYQHATLNAPNVKIVNLEKGESTVHSFAHLKRQLMLHNVNLSAYSIVGQRSGYPSVIIFDENSKQVLLKIRYYSSKIGDRTAHVFEKGPLLHELTKVVKMGGNVTPTQPPAQQAGPTTEPQQSSTADTQQVDQSSNDLDAIKKNAGITA